MYELKIQDYHGIKTIDSREVAQRVEREHKELLKSIRIYCKYLDEGEIPQVDFFIESTYDGPNNQRYPCYLITKKGCDMIANKMTGKKGVLFTAAYVTAFEEMENKLQVLPASTPTTSPGGVASLINVFRRVMREQGSSPTEICLMARNIGLAYGVPLPDKFVKELPGQLPGQLMF